MAYQTLQNTIVFFQGVYFLKKFSMFLNFSMFLFGLQSFPDFQCLPCCPGFAFTAFPGSVAGPRVTAFPEVRFMRCAVH